MQKKKMKFLYIIFIQFSILFLFSFKSVAQSGNIPPFKMMQSNGTFFSATDIPKNKPVVLIYFAPDCGHCQILMNALFKRINDFKNTELVMVTFKPVDEVVGFEKSYGTQKYPNIKVGTEGNTFFLRYYYRLQNTPFTALYSKNGKLITSYRNTTPVDELVNQIRQLK